MAEMNIDRRYAVFSSPAYAENCWPLCIQPAVPGFTQPYCCYTGYPEMSMGAGNKVDPTAFEVADIYETSVCPLAKVMRHELRRRGIKQLKVVFSKEPPITPSDDLAISCRAHCICPPGTVRKCTQRRQIPGSNAFVPSVAGLIIAGEVIKDLTRDKEQQK